MVYLVKEPHLPHLLSISLMVYLVKDHLSGCSLPGSSFFQASFTAEDISVLVFFSLFLLLLLYYICVMAWEEARAFN